MRGRDADREREAIIASPRDPRTEYVPASAGVRVLCGCPRTVLDDGPRSWQLKVYHDPRCPRPRRPRGAAGAVTGSDGRGLGAYLATLPRAIPCPACGEMAWVAGPRPGERRCWGCDHVWAPGRRVAA